MTENDWLTSTDSQAMLDFLRVSGKASDRKVRLFAVACCGRLWHYPLELIDSDGSNWIPSIRNAVLIGEKLADGKASQSELDKANLLDGNGIEILHAFLGCADQADNLLPLVSENAVWAVGEYANANPDAAMQAERAAHADLVREIFGPLPFRLPRISCLWRTPLITSLAQAAYENRVAPDPARPGWLVLDQTRLLVLADALEEAGCTERAILDHLRGTGPHVRGCWPVDLVLANK